LDAGSARGSCGYVTGWRKVLKEDQRAIFAAAAHAQRAAIS